MRTEIVSPQNPFRFLMPAMLAVAVNLLRWMVVAVGPLGPAMLVVAVNLLRWVVVVVALPAMGIGTMWMTLMPLVPDEKDDSECMDECIRFREVVRASGCPGTVTCRKCRVPEDPSVPPDEGGSCGKKRKCGGTWKGECF